MPRGGAWQSLCWSPLRGTTTTSPQPLERVCEFGPWGPTTENYNYSDNSVGDDVAYSSLTPFFAMSGAAYLHRIGKDKSLQWQNSGFFCRIQRYLRFGRTNTWQGFQRSDNKAIEIIIGTRPHL